MSGKHSVKNGVIRPSLILELNNNNSLFTKITNQKPANYSMAIISKWCLASDNSSNCSRPADTRVP